MTADEFIAWSLVQPRDDEGGKFELHDGLIIRQQSERAVHGEVKLATAASLRAAVRKAGLPCYTHGDGATVRINKKKVYLPDALVYCGKRVPPDTVEFPDPMIIVEVIFLDSVGRDHGDKVEAYFSLDSVQHYLIVDPERKAVVHHRRGTGDEFLTRIRKKGALKLDPPGLAIAVGDLFERE